MTGEAKSGSSDPLPAEAFLRTSLADAGSRPALVLLEGDAGSGKSEVTKRWIRAAADWKTRTVLYNPATDGSTAPDLAAVETPALLVVEDVHRAPTETMPWLRAWLREARPGFVTVVSYRPAELPEPDFPLGLDPQLPPPLRIRRERLGAWEQHRTTALALEILGPERSSERLSHQLQQLAGGNPQTIRDLLDSLEEAADASTALQKLEDVEPPVRLTQHITARAASLGGDATALVRAAAVLGGSSRERNLPKPACPPRKPASPSPTSSASSPTTGPASSTNDAPPPGRGNGTPRSSRAAAAAPPPRFKTSPCSTTNCF
ncbi:hypothetical protein ACWEIM_15640 [Streptomyces sp. NPDC004778]